MIHNKILQDYSEFSSWIRTLESIEEEHWRIPIAESKWSISEIVAHLFNWDRYLISEILPAVQTGNEMIFPDFDTYNKRASDYIKSGISINELISQTISTRDLLVSLLAEMPIARLQLHLTANGASHCPHTGTPYSLIHIIKEFTEHDSHHKQQIRQWLLYKGIHL